MTALIFILILAVLILIHELGHFIFAKLVGVPVEELAVGFPPRIFSIKKGETRYSLNLIPLGGYVKLLGEDGTSSHPRAFSNQKAGSRLLVVVAGVAMNIVLGTVLLTIGYSIGTIPLQVDPQTLPGVHEPLVVVSSVLEGGSAQSGGVLPGDRVIALNSQKISSALQLRDIAKMFAGKNISLTVRRQKTEVEIPVALGVGETPLGVGLAESEIVKLPFWQAFYFAAVETGLILKSIVVYVGDALRQLALGGKAGQELAGPVGIYTLTAQAVKLGASFAVSLAAVLSINLAALNILPIPALDGGRGLFILLEGVFRRKVVRKQVEAIIHNIGFILLLLLLLAVTVRDIIRLN